MSYAVGVDVPVSQMPAGMAFDDAGSSPAKPGPGQTFLNMLEGGFLDDLSSSMGGGASQPRSSTPYTDHTRNMLDYLISEAIQSFEPVKSVI